MNDTVDKLVIVARALRPYPPADVGIGGDAVVGTLGTPAVTNRNKVVLLLDEAFDVYGTKRERASATVVRGDATDETLKISTSYFPVAVVAGTPVGWAEVIQATFAGEINIISRFTLSPATSSLFQSGYTVSGVLGGALQRLDGYGSIDVGLVAQQLNTAIVGKYGTTALNLDPPRTFDSGNVYSEYTPMVTVFAPSWRNLLGNVRWNYQGTTEGTNPAWPPLWDQSASRSGNAAIASGVNSITRLTSGNGSYYITATGTSLVREQIVPLGYTSKAWNDPTRPSNWVARGLTMIACGYFRNLGLDSNDTVQLDLSAYDTSFASLGSASTGAFAPSIANWGYREIVMLSAPANTAAAGVKFTLTEVAGGGTTNADTSATELRLFVGQFAGNTSTLLANPSFETGTTASWTVDAGAFVVATTNASPSADYVQGGANATNTIHQDYTLPTGYEYGTAILRCWRMQTLSGDAGEVKVQVLDSLGAVLATVTTGSETLPALNIWYSRLVYVQTVDGAAKIRVSFTALRSLGAGNSGACLDEANLMFAKDLD